VGNQFLVGDPGVFGKSARESEVDVGILVAPKGGRNRCNDERDFTVGETVESGGAAFENVGVRRLRVPRKAIECRQDADASGMAGKYLEEETETVGEGLGAAIGVGDKKGWAAKFVGEVGGDEGFGDVLKAREGDEVAVGT
jgi:hypothetical protein